MKKVLDYINKNLAGIQGNLFLIFAIINFGDGNRFWMFMIASVIFTALQTIINILRTLNSKK